MKVKFLGVDGKEVDSTMVVKADHYVTEINLTLRSNTPVDLDVLKRLLQQRYEVVSASREVQTCYVR